MGKPQLTDVETKVCNNKKCNLYMQSYRTSMRLCGLCGQKLQTQYGAHQNAPVTGTTPAAIATFGAPYPADKPGGNGESKPAEEMVRRKHATVWSKEDSTWGCWCGFKTMTARESNQHDQLPMEQVPKSSLKQGDRYFPLPTIDADKPKQTDDWTCTPDVSGCPLIDATKGPKLEVPGEMWDKWIKLAERMDTEWLAYLIGEPIAPSETFPKGGWKVTDFYFPRQRVTGAHVTVLEEDARNLREGVIGDVHSHVRMSAYFSHEDEKHFNHNVHIVVNARGEFATSVRVELDCKRTSRTKARMYLVGEDPLADLMMGLLEKFVEDKPASTSPSENAGSVSVNGVESSTHSPATGSTKPNLLAGPSSEDDTPWGLV